MKKTFMTSKEYAERCQLSQSHVKELCRQGKIPGAQKIGRDWLISEMEEETQEKGPITAKTVANRLGFSVSHMRRLIREGKMKGTKKGRDWIIIDLEQRVYERQRKAKKA